MPRLSHSSAAWICYTLVATGLSAQAASAQSGSWINATAGVYNWGDATNWQGGVIADGANNTATFATAGLTSPANVTLDSSRTLGSLVFGNPTNGFGWTVAGANTLTLSNSSTPTIALNNGVYAHVAVPLVGTQGLTVTGNGLLTLTGNNAGLSGGITVSAGALAVEGAAGINPLGNNLVTLSGGQLLLGAGGFSGFNANMVVPVGSTFPGPITATMDGGTARTGYTFYASEQNTGAPGPGLPMGSTIVSLSNPTNIYRFQPAVGANALLLDATNTTGRFVLSTPTAGLSQLSFLTSSGNGPGTINATIHYTDGTPDATVGFQSPDWVSGPASAAFPSAGRVSATGYATGGSLYDGTIANPNPSSTIGSVDLSWVGGTTTHTAIFAVNTPVLTSTPAQAFANNVVVTADSRIASSVTATLGNLTIGSNTLSVDGTLNFGSVTMVGNPQFIANGTLTPGPLHDGGVARAITMGGGTVNLSSPSPSLSPGTGLVFNAGVLNLNAANALGPSPIVTVNGGVANVNNAAALGTAASVTINSGNMVLSAGLNPTVASLAGTAGPGGAGVLTLNGNAFSLGGATANFGGAILDGSSAGSLVKNGAGRQTLSGLSTFSGGSTINGGTLAATAVGALGSGPVTLNGGILSVAGAPSSDALLNNFGAASNWSTNGSAIFTAANQLQLTPSTGGDGSAWYKAATLPTGPFSMHFTYTVSNPTGNPADGITVGFQNAGLTALGGGGGSLGYAGISPSVAVALNIYPPNSSTGSGSSAGLFSNGVIVNPTRSTAPVNMGAVNSPTNVTITYDGANIRIFLLQGFNAYSSTPFPVNLAAELGPTAIFGFTGATGGQIAQQAVTNLQFGGPGLSSYGNDVVVAATPATIQVAATPAASSAGLGNATFSIPAATLNVAADPGTAIDQPFSLILGNTTLNGGTTCNVVNNGAGTGTLALGIVSDGPVSSFLVKTGSGTLVLASANTYSGGTSISGGKLQAANTTGSATGTGPVIVADFGALVGGNGGGSAHPFADSTQGFISGNVTVQAGGILAPGTGGAGLLTIGGSIGMQSGSELAVYLATDNPRSGGGPADVNTNSRVTTPVDILIGGALSVPIDGGDQTFTVGDVYDFYIAQAGVPIGSLPSNPTFLPTDFANPVNSSDFALSQSADGRELILTYTPSPVPEPGSLALTGLTVGLGLLIRRKRQGTAADG